MSTHEASRHHGIKGREIAILAADGVNEEHLFITKNALEKEGAVLKIISPKLGEIKGMKGTMISVDHSFLANMSMIFDAIYVPGGPDSISALIKEKNALEFICETYKASKAIATDEDGVQLLMASCMKDWLSPHIYDNLMEQGVIIHTSKEPVVNNFIKAIEKHRFRDRLQTYTPPDELEKKN
jgi:catalase